MESSAAGGRVQQLSAGSIQGRCMLSVCTRPVPAGMDGCESNSGKPPTRTIEFLSPAIHVWPASDLIETRLANEYLSTQLHASAS